MTETITFTTDELRPQRDAVLIHQGIPAGQAVSAATESLYAAAVRLLEMVAAPAGILASLSRADFETVYQGEGRNDPRTPVGEIAPRADHLALFAVTLGQRVVDEITARFQANDLALGAMLDSAASVAADKLADLMSGRFLDALSRAGRATSDTSVLSYSPGYCGWHISGQKRLFEALGPERIGITLRDSCLMDPLKSVSGVLIAGPREIHRFAMSYPFCRDCGTLDCRARIRALLAAAPRAPATED